MKSLKIWVLTQLNNSTTSTSILKAALSKGHDAKIVSPLKLNLLLKNSSTSENSIYLEGKKISDLPDLVLTRMGSVTPDIALHSLQQLENLGIKCINSLESLYLARKKFLSLQILQQNGIQIPATALLSIDTEFSDIIEQIPGPPWILKLPQGTKGTGVMKVDSVSSLKSCVEALHSLNSIVLLQEFIPLKKVCDLRFLVVRGECLGAVRRIAKEGDFRSNLFQGGKSEAFNPSKEMLEIAIKATKALKLEIAGVDILESDQGPIVIEVNSSPGINGIEASCDKNVSHKIIDSVLSFT
ncbi:MAG: RimK family alpha-L-glutamate ligase [Bdellovibrionales bacterium]|nr:RimK family alpha-L-glutamate ligase [Bdellovibrionales bacterium]